MASNHNEDMSNVATAPNLRILDLGYNGIRHITGVSGLHHLRQLYLGRNKIEAISGLEGLEIEVLDLQSNRIRNPIGLNTLTSLKELLLYSLSITNRYLAYNGIAEMHDVDQLRNVNTLDLSNNFLTDTNGFEGFVSLEYVWV